MKHRTGAKKSRLGVQGPLLKLPDTSNVSQNYKDNSVVNKRVYNGLAYTNTINR